MQHPQPRVGADHLTEVDGPPVAELSGPVPELVTAVAHGVWLHSVERAPAGERFDHLGRLHQRLLQPE